MNTLSPMLERTRIEPRLQLDSLNFELPPDLEAHEPPEARGLERDQVRLMVSYRSDNRVVHTTFRDLPSFLSAGDVIVINTSGTLNAAINATRADGTSLELHLSTHVPGDVWTVELRRLTDQGTLPFFEAHTGEVFALPGGGLLTLTSSYSNSSNRLWLANLTLPSPVEEYLARYGFPIRYGYVRENWPISYYQTVYATETGSAEMPILAKKMFENWSACETTRGGMTGVAIHAMISSSLVAMALFSLCLVMSAQLYVRLRRMSAVDDAPQPPDPVDETWKS